MSGEDLKEITAQIKGMKEKFTSYNTGKINSLNAALALSDQNNLFDYPFSFYC